VENQLTQVDSRWNGDCSITCAESRHFSRSSTLTGTLTRWASVVSTTSSRQYLDERLPRVSSLLKW